MNAGRALPISLLLSSWLALGCALTSKSEPISPRYFSPERPIGDTRSAPRAVALTTSLRLGHVSGASYLDQRIVYRDSDYEVGYYQERRWTESPEKYLGRRLARALFEERGIHRVVGGAAPTLEAELVAFEEIRVPARIARVRVIVRLQDQRAVRWEETLTVDQPVIAARMGGGAEQVAEALGLALGGVVDRIAERVASELAALAQTPSATGNGLTHTPAPRR